MLWNILRWALRQADVLRGSAGEWVPCTLQRSVLPLPTENCRLRNLSAGNEKRRRLLGTRVRATKAPQTGYTEVGGTPASTQDPWPHSSAEAQSFPGLLAAAWPVM